MLRSIASAVIIVMLASLASCAAPTRTASDAPISKAALQAVRMGDRGSPLIFIPGLSSGAWAWRSIAERYAKDHVVYLVTLAGFDGLPAAGPAPMAAAERSLLDLIVDERIDRPVLVGHSLGGTIAIHFAEEHSDLIRGVVAVDGLPVFPRSENLPAEQRAAYAARIASAIPRDAASYAASQEAYMASPGGVIDPVLAKTLATSSGRSDPGSVAAYLEDDLTADFRPGLARIAVPVLVISPYRVEDFARGPAPLTEAAKTAYYRALMEGTPDVDVLSISPARHFAMFDAPGPLAAAIDAFLRKAHAT